MHYNSMCDRVTYSEKKINAVDTEKKKFRVKKKHLEMMMMEEKRNESRENEPDRRRTPSPRAVVEGVLLDIDDTRSISKSDDDDDFSQDDLIYSSDGEEEEEEEEDIKALSMDIGGGSSILSPKQTQRQQSPPSYGRQERKVAASSSSSDHRRQSRGLRSGGSRDFTKQRREDSPSPPVPSSLSSAIRRGTINATSVDSGRRSSRSRRAVESVAEVTKRAASASHGHPRVKTSGVCGKCGLPVGRKDEQDRPTITFAACDHFFHLECYKRACVDYCCSSCPSCNSRDRIITQIQSDNPKHRLMGAALVLNGNSSVGTLVGKASFSRDMGVDVWKNIIRDGGAMDILDPKNTNPMMRRDADLNNSSEMSRRALIRGGAMTESIIIVSPFLEERCEPKEVVKTARVQDFLRACVTFDTLIGLGYTLEDLHYIGFSWENLCYMGASVIHLMPMQSGDVPLKVRYMVELYGLNYTHVVEFIACSIAGTVRPYGSDYGNAVRTFCNIGFTKEELNLLDFESFASLLALGNISADVFVGMCAKLKMRIDEIKTFFSLDAQVLLSLGVTFSHLEALGWDEDDVVDVFGQKYIDAIGSARRKEKRKTTKLIRGRRRNDEDKKASRGSVSGGGGIEEIRRRKRPDVRSDALKSKRTDDDLLKKRGGAVAAAVNVNDSDNDERDVDDDYSRSHSDHTAEKRERRRSDKRGRRRRNMVDSDTTVSHRVGGNSSSGTDRRHYSDESRRRRQREDGSGTSAGEFNRQPVIPIVTSASGIHGTIHKQNGESQKPSSTTSVLGDNNDYVMI